MLSSSGGRYIVTWQGDAKDHITPDTSAITVFVFDLDDINRNYEVAVEEVTSQPAKRPVARATLPLGYAMTGGGCRVNWKGEVAQPRPTNTGAENLIASTVPAPGNLLTGSYLDETDMRSWICESKDQVEHSPATITAYVVGLRRRSSGPNPIVRIVKNTSTVAAHPKAMAGKVPPPAALEPQPPFVITGCGGKAEPQSVLPVDFRNPQTTTATPPGQLLTAVFPVIPPAIQPQGVPAVGCQALSKDHIIAAPGTVTAYAINVLLEPPEIDSISPRQGRTGSSTNIAIEGHHFFPGMQLRLASSSSSIDVPVWLGRSVTRGEASVPPTLAPGSYKPLLVYDGQIIGGPRVAAGFTVLPLP